MDIKWKEDRHEKLKEAEKEKLKKVFIESTEEFVASLGSRFIANFLVNREINYGFSFVSNKRVYFKGICYVMQNRKLKKVFEERTVDLKDITGTGFKRINPTHLLITSTVSFSVSMILLPVIMDSVIVLLFSVALVNGIVTLGLYLLKRVNLFEITYAGGVIAFDTNLYDKLEIDNFQKQLRRAKDAIIEEKSIRVETRDTTKSIKSPFGVADELKKYADLLQQNLISQDEYDEVKSKLLGKE